MEHRFVKGFRGSELLYMLSEKNLYRFKRNRDGAKDYICYQTVLSKPTKRQPARNEDRCECNGSIQLYPDGSVRIMSQHVTHRNHEGIMKDMQKSNNMKEKCRLLRDDFTEDAHKMSSSHIFHREIRKYVSCFVSCFVDLSVRLFGLIYIALHKISL